MEMIDSHVKFGWLYLNLFLSSSDYRLMYARPSEGDGFSGILFSVRL